MAERPILMLAPMVRACLDGSKTQTRRIAKDGKNLPPEWATFAQEMSNMNTGDGLGIFRWSEEHTVGQPVKQLRRWPFRGEDPIYDWYAIRCSYGKPGDRLWVRETWREDSPDDPEGALYRATETRTMPPGFKWKPSIFMPRWACRLELEITGVRVERLQDISEADAIAEGVVAPYITPPPGQMTPYKAGSFRQAYAQLWNQINGAGAWDANPWVWVVEFKRVKP